MSHPIGVDLGEDFLAAIHGHLDPERHHGTPQLLHVDGAAPVAVEVLKHPLELEWNIT